MAIFTIPQFIVIGRATTYLMANYQADGALWGTRLIQQGSPVLVNIVTDALRWEWERRLAVIEFSEADKIGINNVDVLLINSTDKLLV